LRSEVHTAQTNVSTANAVVDSSNPIQSQSSAVQKNNDIHWCRRRGCMGESASPKLL